MDLNSLLDFFPHDPADARALFERVIGTFDSARAVPLWDIWSKYEYQYGDLDAALQLEKRKSEAFPACMHYNLAPLHVI